MGGPLREQLAAVRSKYPGLRLKPGTVNTALLEGDLAFRVVEGAHRGLQGNFRLRIAVPRCFPRAAPKVWELNGAIPRGVHVNSDGTLCLAAPIDLDLALVGRPSLLEFLERFLLAFLVGFRVYDTTGRFPYGERPHGRDGIVQGLAEWLGCKARLDVVVSCLRCFLPGQSLSPEEECPCGSLHAFVCCHEERFDFLIRKYGRQGMVELTWRQLELLGYPGGRPESFLQQLQRQVADELLLRPTRDTPNSLPPNIHFGTRKKPGRRKPIG